MIVTCPQCMAKYRVRDEQVPDEGAELECPECGTHFLAQRPDEKELSVVIDKLKDTRDKLIANVEALTRDLELSRSELEASRAQHDAFRAQGEAMRMQLETMRGEALRELRARDDEIGRLRAELDVGSAECARLVHMKGDADREIAHLKAELAKATALALAAPPSTTSMPQELAALLAALPPMLWGLERAVEYLEPFAKNETQLETHVRQLALLRGLMKKLAEHSSSTTTT